MRKPTPRLVSWWLALALVLATGAAYIPALGAGFIWDDDGYVTENPCLADAAGLRAIWVPGHTPQYYPAVFTSFWIEHRLWGLDPLGYHVVNVALHALNALLVWRLCRVLSIPGAWFVGAVFALHPVHVESVAWITERKNVLSGCLALSAALLYLRFLSERDGPRPVGAAPGRPWRWYCASLLAFVSGLLAKTVVCSLPVALLLMLLWQRRRITFRRLVELAPLFAVGLVLALHTAQLERTHVGATGPDFEFSFPERLLIAAKALLFYPQKLLAPWPLSFIYPRWDLEPRELLYYWPVAVVVAAGAVALVAYRRGVRGPALALAYFAATLFPALGFFNVYPMRYSFVADHFQYLASLGPIALLVGGIASRLERPVRAAGAGAVLLAGLGCLTWMQSSVYADEETLWRETARRNPRAWIAHNNLATLARERGANAEALAHLQRAEGLTTSARAADQIRLNLAITLGVLGRQHEALQIYEELQESQGGMHVKLAQTLERLGRDEEAEARFGVALASELRPEALIPFGVHLLRRGRPAEALELLEESVRLRPGDIDARMFLADAYAAAGRLDAAIESAQRAWELARATGAAPLAQLIGRRLEQFRANAPPPLTR